jgi:hypothetical protein
MVQYGAPTLVAQETPDAKKEYSSSLDAIFPFAREVAP